MSDSQTPRAIIRRLADAMDDAEAIAEYGCTRGTRVKVQSGGADTLKGDRGMAGALMKAEAKIILIVEDLDAVIRAHVGDRESWE